MPDIWTLVGSQTIDNLPPSHDCRTIDDPVPPLANLMNFDNFRALIIGENSNVTLRNFNVINALAYAVR